MKINKFLLGAFALSVGFASCSNEEPIKGENGGAAVGEKYMAVRITTSGMGGSRAGEVGTPEFEGAAGDLEGKITASQLYFYFFDGSGNPFPLAYANVNGEVVTNVVKPTTISEVTEGDGTTTTVNGVLVLGKAVGAGYVGTTPSQVLCVANPTVGLQEFANRSLGYVLGALSTVPENGIPAATGFLMTSSTYTDKSEGGGNSITTVDVSNNFKDTPDLAEQNPATIYLERLAAKVRATGLGTYAPKMRDPLDNENIIPGKFVVDNAEANLSVELTGWTLRNTANQSYAFKHITNSQGAVENWFTGWNDSNKHRSYWAVSCAINPLDDVYDIYDESGFAKGSFDAANPTKNIAYCYESTTQEVKSQTDRTSKATAIIVRGVVKKDGVPVDMMRWAGAYYTSDRLKTRIAEAYSSEYGVEVTSEDVSFVKDKNNKYHAQVNNTDFSTNFSDILWWKEGVTSYYLNIAHIGNKFGVVRNHIYDYTFEDVIGLGVPGNDPVNPEDEDETFLAARLHVLNWHVVSNKVILE